MTDSMNYLGQMVWYQGENGVTIPAIIVGLHPEPNTHAVDLMLLQPANVMLGTPFGVEKGSWRFPEIPMPQK